MISKKPNVDVRLCCHCAVPEAGNATANIGEGDESTDAAARLSRWNHQQKGGFMARNKARAIAGFLSILTCSIGLLSLTPTALRGHPTAGAPVLGTVSTGAPTSELTFEPFRSPSSQQLWFSGRNDTYSVSIPCCSKTHANHRSPRRSCC